MVVFIREIDISLSAFVTKTQIFACKGTKNWKQKNWPYGWRIELLYYQYFVRHGLTSSGNEQLKKIRYNLNNQASLNLNLNPNPSPNTNSKTNTKPYLTLTENATLTLTLNLTLTQTLTLTLTLTLTQWLALGLVFALTLGYG